MDALGDDILGNAWHSSPEQTQKHQNQNGYCPHQPWGLQQSRTVHFSCFGNWNNWWSIRGLLQPALLSVVVTRRFLFRNKDKCDAVAAVAFSGGSGTVIEDMAVVTAASCTVIFGARQYQFEVCLCFQASFDCCMKAGPSGTAIEFVVRTEQRQTTAPALVNAFSVFSIEVAAVRLLGAFSAEHPKFCRVQ